jgi:hypothetical protein
MEQAALKRWLAEYVDTIGMPTPVEVWFEQRVINELNRRRALERNWRNLFWAARYLVLTGSLVLPVLITAARTTPWMNTAAVVLSIVVALCTGLDLLLHTGPKWRMYRLGADQIATEATAFFQGIAPYGEGGAEQRLNLFQQRMEELQAEFFRTYLKDLDEVVGQRSNIPNTTLTNP